jgi:hypothetical protein
MSRHVTSPDEWIGGRLVSLCTPDTILLIKLRTPMISGIGDREKVQVRSLSAGRKLSSSETFRESTVGEVIILFALAIIFICRSRMNRSSAKSLPRLIHIKKSFHRPTSMKVGTRLLLTSQTISPSLTFTDVELRVVIKSLLKLR